ncbi:NAD-dependent epimerase/dehydratase family protein [Thermolongibacillus altinsuensis]
MKIVVTGAAGFIGSHLCEALLQHEENIVIGIDSFIGPTPSHIKKRNIEAIQSNPRWILVPTDLLSVNLQELLKDVDVVYHLAGMPGVRTSWGNEFGLYTANNISATQRLLEACKNIPLRQFIYASTSSIYGEKSGKVHEKMEPTPLSPYGITKLAGEHLCKVYETNFHIPTTILRYFTVYGPRQRTDMAFHRFIKQLLTDKPITIFGDGTQSRDFTYISDCVKGTVAVLGNEKAIGQTINIGGKERASVNQVIDLLQSLTGKKAIKHYIKDPIGEPKHTWADLSTAEQCLNYSPTVTLQEGLQYEFADIRSIYEGEQT